MIVPFGKLASQLESSLAPLYFLAGDEYLLVQEAMESIIKTAKSQGFLEAENYEISQQADWKTVFLDADTPSLFASKRILLLSLTRNTLNNQVLDALKEWADQDLKESVIIVRGWTWDYRFRRAAWFKRLSSLAVTIIAESLNQRESIHWIKNRATQLDISLDSETVERLADLTDGNLQAANQELSKLSLILLGEERTIGMKDLSGINFSISGTFDLLNEACAGRTQKIHEKLDSVKREGIQPLMFVGALASHLRRCHRTFGSGQSTPGMRQHLVSAVTRRLGRKGVEDLLAECAHIDGLQKGVLRGDPWDGVATTLLNLSGESVGEIQANLEDLRVSYETVE